jgi:hypothetical protein
MTMNNPIIMKNTVHDHNDDFANNKKCTKIPMVGMKSPATTITNSIEHECRNT